MEDSSTLQGTRGRGLIVEPEPSPDSEALNAQLESSLEKARDDLLNLCRNSSERESAAWQLASEIVASFKPVPWFIWRLTNYVFSSASKRELPEGFVLGLRRLLFATASDELFGCGEKINSLKQSLLVLTPELIGSVSGVHSICRKLAGKGLERFWRPVLDESLLRSRIGYLTGLHQSEFGGGRGLLAGFMGHVGLAILIATGDEGRAGAVIDDLSQGRDVGEICQELYGCHPLHVGGMLLSAIGCGGNACFGVVAFLSSTPLDIVSNYEQRHWLASLTIIEAVRNGTLEAVHDDHWQVLNIDNRERREQILKASRPYVRVDHGLHWLE